MTPERRSGRAPVPADISKAISKSLLGDASISISQDKLTHLEMIPVRRWTEESPQALLPLQRRVSDSSRPLTPPRRERTPDPFRPSQSPPMRRTPSRTPSAHSLGGFSTTSGHHRVPVPAQIAEAIRLSLITSSSAGPLDPSVFPSMPMRRWSDLSQPGSLNEPDSLSQFMALGGWSPSPSRPKTPTGSRQLTPDASSRPPSERRIRGSQTPPLGRSFRSGYNTPGRAGGGGGGGGGRVPVAAEIAQAVQKALTADGDWALFSDTMLQGIPVRRWTDDGPRPSGFVSPPRARA